MVFMNIKKKKIYITRNFENLTTGLHVLYSFNNHMFNNIWSINLIFMHDFILQKLALSTID